MVHSIFLVSCRILCLAITSSFLWPTCRGLTRPLNNPCIFSPTDSCPFFETWMLLLLNLLLQQLLVNGLLFWGYSAFGRSTEENIWLQPCFTEHLHALPFTQPNASKHRVKTRMQGKVMHWPCMQSWEKATTPFTALHRRYINCLFVCLLNFLPSLLSSFVVLSFLLIYFLTYLSTPSRIDPFHFQAGGRRRLPNVALVFWVHFML